MTCLKDVQSKYSSCNLLVATKRDLCLLSTQKYVGLTPSSS